MNEQGCLVYLAGTKGPLGRVIKLVILQTENFIVYMDEEDTIQWYTEGYANVNSEFGAIANRTSYWESIANKVFSKKEAYDYKSLLAEAFARILDSNDAATANSIIDTTVERLKKNGCEVLKQAYILSAFSCTFLLMMAMSLLSFFKRQLVGVYITDDAYQILLTALFGGIGAFIFAMSRFRNYKPEIEISKRVHQIDGALRTFYGVVAGLVVCMAIKANIVFGFLKPGQSAYTFFFMGAIAGASEVLIPNLIKQIDHNSAKPSP